MNLSLFGGTGFVLSRYAQLYPDEALIEPRDALTPRRDDILWGIGTTSNYHAKNGDLQIDIESNLMHTMRVLPNVHGTFNLLSSWFVWGRAAGHNSLSPARETDPCDPNGFYSITALAREKLLRSYCETHNKTYRILRLCNVIGNDPRAGKQKNALEHMLRQVARGEEVTVYTGDCFRNVLHVDDICRAIRLCVEEAPLNEIVNIGAPRSVRMIDLIEHAKALTGSKSRVTLVAPPRFHQVVQTESFWLDTTKLRGLGFVPDMDAYQAVERVLANLSS
jgi:nucleoside-diphosphate-sugar epimerase